MDKLVLNSKLNELSEMEPIISQLVEDILAEFTVESISKSYSYDDKDKLLKLMSRVLNSKLLGDLDVAFTIEENVDAALEHLKAKKYPEVTGIKYYKEYLKHLKEELSQEELIELDHRLAQCYQMRYHYASLGIGLSAAVEEKVLRELYEMSVIAPAIEVSCPLCGDDSVIGHAQKGKDIRQVLGLPKSQESDSSDIQDILDELSERCFCEDCYINMTSSKLEILDEFNNPKFFGRFMVIKEPDMTLDEL